MTKALFGVEGEGQSDVQLMPSTVESGFEERNYFGLSDSSTVDSSTVTSFSGDSKDKFNLEATELRLGLPGSQCPEIDPELCLLSCGKLDEKPLLTLIPLKDGICSSSQKTAISGNKRGFSVTMEDSVEKTYSEGNWMFRASGSDSGASKSGAQGKIPVNGGMPAMLSSRPLPNSGVKSYVREQSGSQQGAMTGMSPKAKLELPSAVSGMGHSQLGASTKSNCEPAARAQVVGWPPIRSFRKNSLTNTSKNNDEVDGKPGAAPLFVKVSMDGAPYLRKVDLRVYSAYQELSSALGKMFSCFTLGQCGTHGASGRENGSETKLMDLLHGSEYVLTYEDKDGDWMLVGDVPWEMFIDSCKRLKVMKSSNAIGLAPRVMEKSKNRN
ncbi:hypothetical protein Nepgr_026493 [Nepenthes gracilis]|uniref:Auxin-responsive protein n=1 Tax=Nepenthes gracilis TaxID=150966 RepID=A0AAD3T702_NEPGR|nr:hypothetical protein Nepgr_026493 [Nepenthes gracilis]